MTTPLNGIKANWFHDEGAIAQCGRCQRYTLDRAALSDRQPTCTCGEKHYWSGSFLKPGPDAQWHGVRPTVPSTQATPASAVGPVVAASIDEERLPIVAWANVGPEEGEVYSVSLSPQPYHDSALVLRSDALAIFAEVAGLEASCSTLDRLVDELRELLQDAKRAMTELHQAAIPDESTEGVPAIIPPEAFRKFVDAHAQLCFLMHQCGHNPAPGAQHHG